MANGHGGKRLHSGRKPKDVEVYRREMERTFLACVTEDDWAEVVAKAVTQAKDGDASARQWLSDRVMPRVRVEQKLEVSGPGGGPIQTQSFDYEAALTPLAARPVEDR